MWKYRLINVKKNKMCTKPEIPQDTKSSGKAANYFPIIVYLFILLCHPHLGEYLISLPWQPFHEIKTSWKIHFFLGLLFWWPSLHSKDVQCGPHSRFN